ncbi:MAG: SUMF1/EgtB/PvdO family nonheme iron enzyme [Phycisphaerales bacterium]|nr:MAG: SUMF1/EgtB/PvdO family nonheme iron enzyme [Phycisphaerales bacterium]
MGQLETPLASELLPIFRGRGLFDSLANGDYDERPVHKVNITRPFYIGVYEVTNNQYELFRPEHSRLRGKRGFSKGDDEAVCFVSWYDAKAFCDWLSDKEGLPYRLPTEAEWEYACRADTETHFHTGDTLPGAFLKKVHRKGSTLNPQDLTVGRTPANKWGIFDMHGNLEEWTHDWYGPYVKGKQKDPIGYKHGEFRVTRGGSHGSDVYYLRSANRLGAIPESRNWVTGFRVVIGEMPKTKALKRPVFRHQKNVKSREAAVVTRGPDPDVPYFHGPLRYVNIPRGSEGPTWQCHNHDPAIAECPNGDLLTIWYSCCDEHGRELGQVASRLRYRSNRWEQADLYFYVPDRNNHAPALWYDDRTRQLFHFTGVAAAKSRGHSALVMRTSADSGKTWSNPRFVSGEFDRNHLPSEPVFRMNDGTICFAIDGPNTLWMSKDDGRSWFNPGGDIPGIHAGVTQLADGRLFAMTRGPSINGKLPICISEDGGKTFNECIASPFHSVGGGRRLALMRLRQGYLFLCSTTHEQGPGMLITDSSGQRREIRGMYAALSMDNGKTWPYRRLITHDGSATTIECTDGAAIALSSRSAEYRGYIAACQSLDGLIHVISSRNHYAFNLKWLMTPPPPPADEPMRVKAEVETFSGPQFDLEDWHDYKGPIAHFNGNGQFTIKSGSHYNGINRRVGTGSFEAVFELSDIRYNEQGPVISEGVTLGFRDSISEHGTTMFVWIKMDKLLSRTFGSVPLSSPPKSAKIRFIYDESTFRWRVFYGLNGAEPVTEFEKSREGFYNTGPTSESIAAYILMSNGSVDLDHFEIVPVNR